MSHTLAPWEIINGGDISFAYTSIATVYQVETVPTQDGLGAGYVTIVSKNQWQDDYRAEQTANARLIAAAPELLQACEELLQLLGHEGDYAPDPEESSIGFAVAAVNKAKGI